MCTRLEFSALRVCDARNYSLFQEELDRQRDEEVVLKAMTDKYSDEVAMTRAQADFVTKKSIDQSESLKRQVATLTGERAAFSKVIAE